MRPFLRTAIVGLVGWGTLPPITTAVAQGVSFDSLNLASDLRFTAGHCFAIKVDWNRLQTYLRSRGVPMAVFDPDSLEASYINARDRDHEADLKGIGVNAFCKRYYVKYYSTGIFRQKPQAELDDLNAMRRSNGGDDIKPLE